MNMAPECREGTLCSRTDSVVGAQVLASLANWTTCLGSIMFSCCLGGLLHNIPLDLRDRPLSTCHGPARLGLNQDCFGTKEQGKPPLSPSVIR